MDCASDNTFLSPTRLEVAPIRAHVMLRMMHYIVQNSGALDNLVCLSILEEAIQICVGQVFVNPEG